MKKLKRLSIFGTRPEAIKMAPLVQVLNLFDIQPDYDLNIMKPGQDLTDVTCNILDETASEINTQYRDFRVRDVQHSLADISKAKELLGYNSLYTIKIGLDKGSI